MARIALLAAALAACSSAPPVHPALVTPLQSSTVYSEIELKAPEVTSRESDTAAKSRNQAWADLLTDRLRKALAAKGKRLGTGGRYALIARAHLVYKGERSSHSEELKREAGSVEVQLVLQDTTRNEVAYSTLTKNPIAPGALASWFGWGADADEIIRQTLEGAVADFAARL